MTGREATAPYLAPPCREPGHEPIQHLYRQRQLCRCSCHEESGREATADEPHPRVCPNGLDCPCYDEPWHAPVTSPARETTWQQ